MTQNIHFLEKYKSNFTGVYDICDTSGQERKVEIFMTGDFDNDVIIKRYGIIQDVTKQHHQNVESEFLKQRIALALNTSSTGTIGKDNNGVVVSMRELKYLYLLNTIQKG